MASVDGHAVVGRTILGLVNGGSGTPYVPPLVVPHMPQMSMEMCFTQQYSASPAYVDVSPYLALEAGITWSRGRSDPLGVSSPGVSAWSFDNDGRFTPGQISSPYYPNVKINRAVRLTATWNGIPYRQFTHFTDPWQTSFEGGLRAITPMTATDRTKLLARKKLNSMYVEECGIDEPAAVYMLGEDAGATSSINNLTASYQGPSVVDATDRTVIFGLGDPPPDTNRLATQTALGKVAGIYGTFYTQTSVPNYPGSYGRTIHDAGSVFMFYWDPTPGVANDPLSTLRAILAGTHDNYIRTFAQQIQAVGYPVLVRLWAEFNTPNHPCNPGVNGNQISEFIPAWQHVVNVCRAAGATNMIWVWNPIKPAGTYTAIESLWPGQNYVDWLGMDGYNWGDTTHGPWLSFSAVFASFVAQMRAISRTLPLMICEVGCNNTTQGDKAVWLTDMYQSAANFGIRAIVYFDYALDGADWRFSQPAAALTAAAAAVHAPTIIGGGDWTVDHIGQFLSSPSPQTQVTGGWPDSIREYDYGTISGYGATGPMPDHHTALRLWSTANGDNGGAINFLPGFTMYPFTVEMWARIPATEQDGTPNFGYLWAMQGPRGGHYIGAGIYSRLQDGKMQIGFASPGSGNTAVQINDFSAKAYNDGKWHHVVGEWTADSAYLFVDGVTVAHATSPGSGSYLSNNGGYSAVGKAPVDVPYYITMDVAGLAFYPDKWMSITRIAAHYQTGLHLGIGELSGARIGRILNYSKTPEVAQTYHHVFPEAIDNGNSRMELQDTEGVLAWDATADAVQGEQGLLFVDGGGTVRFRDRDAFWAPPVSFTLTAKQLGADFSILIDDTLLINECSANRKQSSPYIARNYASQDEYGVYSDDIPDVPISDSQLVDFAQYRISKYSTPGPRTYQATVTPSVDTALYPAMLACEPGQRFTITGLPFPLPPTLDLIVQSVAHSVTQERWQTTIIGAPTDIGKYALWDNFTWDNALWAW